MIHIACPMRATDEEEFYKPMNFKQLVYFHSRWDGIIPWGKLNEAKIQNDLAFTAANMISSGIVSALVMPSVAQNVLKENPSEFKGFSLALAFTILNCAHYMHFVVRQVSPAMRRNNHFAPQSGASVIGLITESINGKSLGHSELVDVVKYLPELFQRIENKYIDYAAKSFTAQLWIEDPEIKNYNHWEINELHFGIHRINLMNQKHNLPETMPLFPQFKRDLNQND
jgi:hypothetical protein